MAKVMLAAIISALTLAADPAGVARVDVTETGGVYSVTAAFAVSYPPEAVMAVLTDYERIPAYVPDMEISKVIERTAAGMLVEQQAVSKFMMFSKRVHLLLEVREGRDTIHFSDRCGKSFSAYDGSWMVSQHDSLTVVDYQLRAKPMFEVPPFVLKRLLKRDSAQLIERIKAQIAERANQRS
jgi:ribosome-associated toxin RatA of RatAB toxin-antitoxin module